LLLERTGSNGGRLEGASQTQPARDYATMENIWQPNQAMNERECEAMAAVLEAKHGLFGRGADFFATMHTGYGDECRSIAWADVAERVRLREHDRLQQD
jgi:hypothetical protein